MGLINTIFKKKEQVVPSSQYEEVNTRLGLANDCIREFEKEVRKLNDIINGDDFIPAKKPNTVLAAETVCRWSNETKASFLKKLVKQVDDSIIVTLNRYITTEVRRRKLTEEDLNNK